MNDEVAALLEAADELVKAAELRVAEQRETITQLEELDRDTSASRLLLETLRRDLGLAIEKRDRILAEFRGGRVHGHVAGIGD